MKTALVTGANRGLGRGFVEYLLSVNFKVIAAVRNPLSIDKELLGNSNLSVVSLDIVDDRSIQQAYNFIEK